MNIPILVSNRFIKVFANILKAFSYIFHFVFPKKRFTIPLNSKPIVSSKRATLIPKIIWQTNYTNKVSLPVYLNYLFNRLMSLDYEYNYISTEARQEYLKQNAPKNMFKAFEQLTDGASQADFWRLFVLNHKGGIYMDIDAHFVWPLSRMIQTEDTEVFLLNKQHFTNYFIATTANNPILNDAINLIVDNIENKRIEDGVYALSGPSVLNTAIGEKKINYRYYRETCIQGSFTNEYFQYIDKRGGKWIHTDRKDLLK